MIPSKHPPDTLDRLAELWAKGYTTTDIGVHLRIAKNSICRLARDARLRGDERFPVRQPKAPPKGGAPARTRHKAPLDLPRLAPISVAPLIWQLRQNDCRYPVESEGLTHRFCARPQHPGSPYCPDHKKLCDGARLHR